MDTKEIEKILYLKEIGVEYLSNSIGNIYSDKESIKKDKGMDFHQNKIINERQMRKGKSKEEFLEEIKKEVFSCKKCPLFETKKNYVFGEGSFNAKIMFVGEAPGADEDIQGRPFVGKAGKKLTEMIYAMGYKREEIYIANIVKCRPPGNATPTPEIRKTCFPFLQKQIAIIKPKVIITMGNVATQTLLNTKETITRIRGKFGFYQNIPVMPTFHPSYIIRNYTINVRKQSWSDLQKVMKYIDESN